MNSFPIKGTNQNNIKNKQKSSKIEIEYEKISPKINSQIIPLEENENFNVYFMKPDLKYKTISTSNSLTSSRMKTLNKSKNDSSKEKEFKSHLIQKLKALKLNQRNKDKIPLNIASKIRREESIRNSLKYLLAKQAQYDPKKELLYYKAYFRFWKRKCKNEKYNHKRIIKKDKNIRITTVIYLADKPNKYKTNKIIEENKNENNEKNNTFFRNKLIRIMETKSKEKIIKNKNDNNNNNINKRKIVYYKRIGEDKMKEYDVLFVKEFLMNNEIEVKFNLPPKMMVFDILLRRCYLLIKNINDENIYFYSLKNYNYYFPMNLLDNINTIKINLNNNFNLSDLISDIINEFTKINNSNDKNDESDILDDYLNKETKLC